MYAFNITQEIFNEVPLPEIIQVAKSEIHVSLLEKCLCITMSCCYQTNKFDVWVMKEYGRRDSWCKLFTLWDWYFHSPLTYLKPLCYYSDRSKVLLEVECWNDFMSDSKKLFWYYLDSKNITCVPGIPTFNDVMLYIGSLLPPSLPIDNSPPVEAREGICVSCRR